MIVLYTAILILLIAVRWLVQVRARRLEKRYSRLSLDTSKMAQQPVPRQGNSHKPDIYAQARQQFELGRMVQQRDRVESHYFRWQQRAEKLGRLINAFRQWKGKKLPYTFGVIDVSMLLYAIDRVGLGSINLTELAQTISTMISR